MLYIILHLGGHAVYYNKVELCHFLRGHPVKIHIAIRLYLVHLQGFLHLGTILNDIIKFTCVNCLWDTLYNPYCNKVVSGPFTRLSLTPLNLFPFICLLQGNLDVAIYWCLSICINIAICICHLAMFCVRNRSNQHANIHKSKALK